MPFREGSLTKIIHDDFTAMRKDAFISALKKVHTVGIACEIVGITRRTAYDWRNADEDFKQRWLEAVEFSKEALESATYIKAFTGKSPQAITASIFLLKGMYPDKYRENTNINLKTDDRQAPELTEDELIAVILENERTKQNQSNNG